MPEHSSVVTVGTFDGVHLGHREILGRVRALAAEKHLRPIVVTFRPHPLAVVNPSAAPMLLTPDEEQLDALQADGPLEVVVLEFTPALARHTADEFVREILIDRFRVTELVIGYDHGLGRGRQGDAAALQRLGAELGFSVEIVAAALDAAGAPISSSSIRTSIAHGDLERAKAALGRPYGFSGRVVPGEQRGRELGYPTANIQLRGRISPVQGIFAVRVGLDENGCLWPGVASLGLRPTVNALGEPLLEVHLFDFDGDLYGRRLRVEFVAKLRDEVKFDGLEPMREQMTMDARMAREVLGMNPSLAGA